MPYSDKYNDLALLHSLGDLTPISKNQFLSSRIVNFKDIGSENN